MQSTPGSEHFSTLRYRKRRREAHSHVKPCKAHQQGIVHLVKSEQKVKVRFCSRFKYNHQYTGLYYITVQHATTTTTTTLHYSTLITLHYTTLDYTIFNYMKLRYTTHTNYSYTTYITLHDTNYTTRYSTSLHYSQMHGTEPATAATTTLHYTALL